MKHLIIILSIALSACTSLEKADQQDSKESNEQEKTETKIQLNNNTKWKADEATKLNVDAMIKLVNDSNYAVAAKRKDLIASMQAKIDTLIKECRMKGPDHDAFHAWREKVLKSMKELGEKEDEFGEAFADLKKDVESFNESFE